MKVEAAAPDGTNEVTVSVDTATHGIPQGDGSIKSYVVSYFTDFAQAATNYPQELIPPPAGETLAALCASFGAFRI